MAVCVAGCGDDTGSGDTEVGSGTPATTSSSTGSSSDASTTLDASSSTSDASEVSSGDESSSTGEPIPRPMCWDDLPEGEVEVLYDGFEGGSEGIAFGIDGTLHVTTLNDGDGTVWSLDARGGAVEFADVPYALGLAPIEDGTLVVASLGEINQPDGGVYTVSPSGEVALVTDAIDSPNFVTIAPDGSALISDDFDTRVFRVGLDGDVTTVIENVTAPNGMAYSPARDALYVASTFTTSGQLTRYDLDEAGLPIESTALEILHTGAGQFNDGIAVDLDNRVYVAANVSGRLWRVDGGVSELTEGDIVVEDLDTPASLAFGEGEAFDPCSVYVTELGGTRVVRVSIGTPGAPLVR